MQNSKRQSKRKRTRKNQTVQRALVVPKSPRFAPMPTRFKVRLPYRYSTDSDGSVNIPIGLFDYLNNLPLYASVLYQMYRYSRIIAVDIEAQANGFMNPVAPPTSYGFDLAIGKMPYSDVATTSPDLVAQTNGSVHTKGGYYGGVPVTLRHKFNSQDALGNPIYGEGAWQTLAQATSVIPTTTQKPVIVVAFAPTPAIGSSRVSLTLTVMYHVEFFDLDVTPLITRGKNQKEAKLKPVRESSFDSELLEDDDLPPISRQKTQRGLSRKS